MATDASRRTLLVLASTFPVSDSDGVPAFVLDIARQEALDFDVTVLTPQVPGASLIDKVGSVSIQRFRYFFSRWEDLADGAILDNLKARPSRLLQVPSLLVAQALAIRRLRKQLSPAAIHAHWVIPQGLSSLISARRVPTLITTHGGDVYALNNPIALIAKKWVLRHAAAVSTVNNDMLSRLASWGVSRERMSVLPMGVSLTDATRVKAGTKPIEGRLLVVGRLVEKKGIAVLLDALSNHVSGVDWTLRIVGDGPIRQSLEHLAADLPVTFLGQLGREQVLHEMAAASVLVLPSVAAASGDQEGLPVVLLEAAAMGCAIVASDLPGINEALTDDVNGVLLTQGDSVALGDALSALLSDDARRTRLGDAAKERSRHYSITLVGERYRALLNQIAR